MIKGAGGFCVFISLFIRGFVSKGAPLRHNFQRDHKEKTEKRRKALRILIYNNKNKTLFPI